MVPGTLTNYSRACTCGGGTCICMFQQWGGTQSVLVIPYNSPIATAWPVNVPEDDGPRARQGWRLEVACTEEAQPEAPRAERRAAPAPCIVGGGPMRRRWR